MGARHSGREAALQLLFSMEANGQTAAEVIDGFWHTFQADPEGREYAEAIVQGVEKDKVEIDAMITASAKNWRIERMTRIDRNLLRLGVWELTKRPDVPREVVLDEAVELAKSFGSDASASFVNGVLDAIADTLKKA